MKYIITVGILAASFVSFSQGVRLKKADKLFNKVAYSEAASIYSELVDSDKADTQIKAKLAKCYYEMGETTSAEKYYAEIVNTEVATSEDIYNYAQSLKENGKYEESNTWMQKFHAIKADDSRGAKLVKNSKYLELINAQEPYFSINHLAINSEQSDYGGYPNGEKVFFISNRAPQSLVKHFHTWSNDKFFDVYSAEVSSSAQLENPKYHSRKANKRFHEGPLCFSLDGKKVYFTQNNMSGKRYDENGIQNLKIMVAEIDEKGKWHNVKELSINSKDYSVGHPTISADGKYLYFVSDMPGGIGGADIYRGIIQEDGDIGQHENLGSELNTEGQEMFPWMNEEGILFFSSDGHLGLGGLDVFAMIPTKDGGFKKLINLGKPVNSTKDDFALTTNNGTGYVSSNRSTGSGMDDIYSIKLLRSLNVQLSVKGYITDSRSKKVLPNAKIDLLDENGSVIASTIADEKGFYAFNLEEDQEYDLVVTKDDYFENKGSVSTKNLPAELEELEKDLSLEKDPGLALHTLIVDSKTKQPIEGVQIIITDNISGEVFAETTTGSTGDLLKGIIGKKLEDRVSYNIVARKNGFFPKTITHNQLIDKPGTIEVEISLDEEIKDLAVLINPINFDLGKWNIRKDAAEELDKIVAIMNEYPSMVIELGAHTDCRGSKRFNERLSDKRAKSSAAYIKSRITDPERISGKGYGESRLLNGCECEGAVKSDCSEEEHAKNRRTEFLVISTGDDKVKVVNQSTDSFDK